MKDKHSLLLDALVDAASRYVSKHGNADGSDQEYADLQLAIVDWNIYHNPIKPVKGDNIGK